MREWLPLRDEVLRQLVSLDGALEEDLFCWKCGEPGLYRCTTCFTDRISCGICFRAQHVTAPFHFVEVSIGTLPRELQ